MEKSVILPVDLNPMILSRYHIAFPFSVFQKQNNEILQWAVSNFIDIVYDPSALWQYHFYIHNPWLTQSVFTKISTYSFSSDCTSLKSFDILEKVRLMLSKGYYVRGDFNTAYIKAKRSFNEYPYNCEYLLYGYNDEIQNLVSLGRTVTDIYCGYRISYDEYLASLINRTDQKINLNFIKIDNTIKPQLPVDVILTAFKNYINSTPLEKDDRFGKQYGINCMNQFSSYVRKVGEVFNFIDDRYIRFFSEHKCILNTTVHMLAESGLLLDDNPVLTVFENNYKDSLLAAEYLNEYNTTHNCKNIIEADRIIRNIVLKEKQGIKIITELSV